jgi:hypothetical protein
MAFVACVQPCDLEAWVFDHLRVDGGPKPYAGDVLAVVDAITSDTHRPPFGALGDAWVEYLRHVDIPATLADLELRRAEVVCECRAVSENAMGHPRGRACGWRGTWIETRLVRYVSERIVATIFQSTPDAATSAHAPPLMVGLFGVFARVSALCVGDVARAWDARGVRLDDTNPFVQVIA